MSEPHARADGADARSCARCLLPASVPGLLIDAEGMCHFCRSTPPADELAVRRARLREQMESVIDSHRGARPYECVLAFSGGKDSSYTLKLLVEHYHLRVLAVTVDNGFLSVDTLDNCRAVCNGVSVDHVVFRPDSDFMNRMYRRSAVGDDIHSPAAIQRASSICSSCITLINTFMVRKALELGAPMIAGGYLAGQLPRDAALFFLRPATMAKTRTSMLERFARAFGEDARAYFELPVEADGPREVTVINPMMGVSLTEDDIVDSLTPLGWRRPRDTGLTSTNCRLNDLGVFLHSRRHGFHPYAFEIAEQLRHGLMTAAEAQRKLTAIPAPADVAWLAARLDVDLDVV